MAAFWRWGAYRQKCLIKTWEIRFSLLSSSSSILVSQYHLLSNEKKISLWVFVRIARGINDLCGEALPAVRGPAWAKAFRTVLKTVKHGRIILTLSQLLPQTHGSDLD